MYFFSSDTHLGSVKSIRRNIRPFRNIKVFTRKLIKTWNKQTNKDDTIFVLGDFVNCNTEDFNSWKQYLPLVKKFKARIVLVLGNNEERIVKYFFDGDFEKFRNVCILLGYKDVVRNCTITMRGVEFYLTHEPLNCKKDCLNLFGHVHAAGGIYYPFGLNVGCDLHHFKLLDEDAIFHWLNEKKQYWNDCKHLNMKFKQD
jgi:calcineurin-like phosphoesterase family protein